MDPDHVSRDDVLALYGAAMHAAQEFEEAMVGLVGVRNELALIEEDAFDELDSIDLAWQRLFTWMAGRLRGELQLHGQLGDEVDRAVAARNLLAHHYLRDHAQHLENASGEQRCPRCFATRRTDFRPFAQSSR